MGVPSSRMVWEPLSREPPVCTMCKSSTPKVHVTRKMYYFLLLQIVSGHAFANVSQKWIWKPVEKYWKYICWELHVVTQHEIRTTACDASSTWPWLQMHLELSVTMVPCRASPVWLELKKLHQLQEELHQLQEEELQQRDVELAKTSSQGKAFCHHPVPHTRPCMHSGETLQR